MKMSLMFIHKCQHVNPDISRVRDVHLQGIHRRSRSRLLQALDNAANGRFGHARRMKIIEKLNYKIREAQMEKIPYMLIVGEKEKENGTVTVRMRDGKNLPPMSVNDFAAKVLAECQEGRGI